MTTAFVRVPEATGSHPSDQAASHLGAPRFDPSRSDPGDPGACEWVAERLTVKQLEALKVLASYERACGGDTRENGLAPSTLWSLNDFRRGERGIQAPLACVSWEAGYDLRRYWGITDFGERVLGAALSRDSDGSGEAGETGTGSMRSTTARAEGIAQTTSQPPQVQP
jgi:hypothetical protein